jgi:hypothetical protein
MKGFYRKILPLLVIIVLFCIGLNYSISGGGIGNVAPSQPSMTDASQPNGVIVPPAEIDTKEIFKNNQPNHRPFEKKKIAYAITITKDGRKWEWEELLFYICTSSSSSSSYSL